MRRAETPPPSVSQAPLIIAAIYAIIGALWILFSDRILLEFVHDPERIALLSTYKGWGYVLVTALLLFLMVRHYLRRQSAYADKLAREQQLFRTTLETLPVGVVIIDASGMITHGNKAFEDIWGGLRKLEKADYGEYRGWWSASGKPIEAHEWGAARALTRGESSIDEIIDIEAFNGQRKTILHSSVPLRNENGAITGAIAVNQDITVHRRAEEALRASEEQYRYLFANNPHPMWVYDLETLAFLAVNDAAVDHYGYTEEEFLSLSIKQIRPEEDIEELLKNVGLVDGGIDKAGVWRHRKKDGSIIFVEITSHTLTFNDRPAELVLANDVTLRIAAEQEIINLNAALEQRVELRTAQLEELNRELESFSYSISHDLRMPLRHIDAYSRLLLEDLKDKLGDEGERHLQRICKSTVRMGQMIDGLLALSRVTRDELHRQTVDLGGMALEICREFQAMDKNRQVECRVGEGLVAEGDSRLLRTVLENLMGNAWKYTTGKEQAVIECGSTDRDGERAFFVRDNGAGFAMEYADKLFVPFQRLHSEQEFPGIGVGLATVQRIIRLHDGRIWAESTPGNGATFFFTLGGTNHPP